MKPAIALFPVLTVALLLAGTPAHASPKMDNRIEASARKSYVFQTYLKGDDITVQSRDGLVTLTGSVHEESHKSLARETVAELPGVKKVDNRAEKDLVTKLASDVNGVNIVKNRMAVTGSR